MSKRDVARALKGERFNTLKIIVIAQLKQNVVIIETIVFSL